MTLHNRKNALLSVLLATTVILLAAGPALAVERPLAVVDSQRIADEYDELWTTERMQKVIDAAIRNDIAIEINARYRIPSKKFIQLGKKTGCKFSFGTNNTDKNLGNLEYCRQMIKECGLTTDDMFVLKPHDKKPILTKGLPKK